MAIGFCVSRNPFTGQTGLYGSFENEAGQRLELDQMRQLYPKLITEIEKAVGEKETQLKFPVKMELNWNENQGFSATRVEEAELTAQAKLKILLAWHREQKINTTELCNHLDEAFFGELMGSRVADPNELSKLTNLFQGGITVYQGAVCGPVFTNAEDAANHKQAHPAEDVILCKEVLEPSEAKYVQFLSAMMTVSSGLSSHAAIIARIKAVPCITGVSREFFKNLNSGQEIVFKADSQPGIWQGRAKIQKGDTQDADFLQLIDILKKEANVATGRILWANADSAVDIIRAQELGAGGIGLVRTEHMVLNNAQTQKYLQAFYLGAPVAQKLMEGQAAEFKQIFEAARAYKKQKGVIFPITIRLLDFPMHEILPAQADLPELAKLSGVEVSLLQGQLKNQGEENPMLGCRGVRLTAILPEIYDLQIQAILLALKDSNPSDFEIKIMIPMVMLPKEMFFWRNRIHAAIGGPFFDCFKIGAMLEIPSACLMADEIAKAADFLSIGSNDLTQMCYGLSRDDATLIQNDYIDKHWLEASLFAELGPAVADLIRQAGDLARKSRPRISITVCGEHAGNLKHTDFWKEQGIGMSAAPARLPLLAWQLLKGKEHA